MILCLEPNPKMIRNYAKAIQDIRSCCRCNFFLHFGSSHAFDRQLKTMLSSPISIEITPVKSLKSTRLPTQKYISRSIYLHHKVNAMRLILSQTARNQRPLFPAADNKECKRQRQDSKEEAREQGQMRAAP